MIFSPSIMKGGDNVIAALIFGAYMLGVMALAGIIVTGIHHINLWLERKNDEKKSPSKYEKYEKLFKYNP